MENMGNRLGQVTDVLFCKNTLCHNSSHEVASIHGRIVFKKQMRRNGGTGETELGHIRDFTGT